METISIQVSVYDSVYAVCARIKAYHSVRILVILPEKQNPITRLLDLKLLLRAARKHNNQLALKTHNFDVVQLADELGIPVFELEDRAQKQPWRRGRARKQQDGGKPEANVEDLRRTFEKQRQKKILNWKKSPGYRWASFITGVVSVLVLLMVFVPSASIKLPTKKEAQSFHLEVLANPQIQAPNLSGGIPADEISVVVEGRAQIESTGFLPIPDERASGQVRLTNLTDDSVYVSSGTIVMTVGETVVRFETVLDVEVPAGIGESVDVPVLAVLPGESGNVDEGEIKAFAGTTGLLLSVTNLSDMHGGSERASPIPVEADYEQLKANLLEELRNTALLEIESKVGEDRIIEESVVLVEVLEEAQEPEIGQPADELQLTQRLEFRGWYYRESDIQTLAEMVLNANLAKEKKPVNDTIMITNLSEPVVHENSAQWEILVGRQVQQDWALESGKLLIGKSLNEVEQILEQAYALEGKPTINMQPVWWPRMPLVDFRIGVEVE